MPLPSRKRHTKNSTSLPKDFVRTVADLFQEQFKAKLQGATFLVFGELHPDEVILAVSLAHPDSLPAASLHLSMDPPKNAEANPDKVTEQLKVMVDVAASWFAQSLESGQGLEGVLEEMREATPAWQEVDWEEKHLFVKLNRDNYTLEKAADDLLRKAGFDPEEDDAEAEEILNDAFSAAAGDDDEDSGSRGPLQ